MAKIEVNETDIQDEALNITANENTQLAKSTVESPFLGFEGEMDATDFQLPYLKVWSPSSTEAEQGIGRLHDLMINSVVVANDKNPLECVVLKFKKFYKERVPYGEQRDEYPKTWAKEADYIADGFSRFTVDRVLELGLLVKKPAQPVSPTTTQEDLDSMFTVDFMDEKWMLVRFFAQATAYANVAKPLLTFMATVNHPQGVYPFRVYIGATTATSKTTNKKYAIPTLKVSPRSVDGQADLLLNSGLLNSIPSNQ